MLTTLEQKTIEWINRIETYDKEIHDKVTMVKDTDINIAEVPSWNRLTLSEYDKDFTKIFQHTISDESVPEADDY